MRFRRRKPKQLEAVGDQAKPSPDSPAGTPSAAPTGPKGQAPKGKKRVRRPKGPARQTRWMRVLGLLIATGGGVAIGFGWAGAAQEGCVDCQIPYLLSGGAAGIGLIIFGVALLLLAQIRTESRRLGDRIEQALAGRVRTAERQRPVPAESPPTQEYRPTESPPTLESRPTEAPPVTEAQPETERPPVGEPEPVRDPATEDEAPTAALNPLSAVPVDAPAESDADRSDAATLAATTVAGGVVDTDSEEGRSAESREAPGESEGEPEAATGSHPEPAPGPPSGMDQAQEVLARRSAGKRRGLAFWRRPER